MHRVLKLTQGTETSQYLQEKKETSIPSVAASERGLAQTGLRTGVVDTDMVLWMTREPSVKVGPKKVIVL